MRRLLTPLALVLAATALPAAADHPTYPIESIDDWLTNPVRDATDFQLGQYQFEAGFLGAVRRFLTRTPTHAGDPPEALLQEVIDSLTHNRPRLPYSHPTDAGAPIYMPDWDHDGTFGDSGGPNPAAGEGDFDATTDDVLDTAYFRYLCTPDTDPFEPTPVAADGTCAPGAGGVRLGLAHEVSIIDARGLRLSGTLWLPHEAITGACPAVDSPAYDDPAAWVACLDAIDGTWPGLVFNNGLASRQDHYHWVPNRLTQEGFIVLTFDPAGQGESEGGWMDLYAGGDPDPPACRFAGSCRDAEDVLRWFAGHAITAVPTMTPRVAPRLDPAANAPNPALEHLDTARLAIAGNSMGALATLHVLDRLAEGTGTDGRPCPRWWPRRPCPERPRRTPWFRCSSRPATTTARPAW